MDQLCIAGRSHNFLVLADASPHLKIFLNPYGLSEIRDDTKVKCSWKCHLIPGGHSDVITDLCVSNCGEWLVSGSKDQSICLWRIVEDAEPKKAKISPVNVTLFACLNNAHTAHISAVRFDQ